MSVLAGSEYICVIDEVNKKVTVNITDKTKSELTSVLLKFVISDNAIFGLNGIQKISEESIVNISAIAPTTTIKIIAENTQYYTDYEFIVSCSGCGK